MAGRPKNFEPETVLDSAMQVFWEQGYEATSYTDLVQATGIGKQSLYHAFGDKRSLFTKVLEHYSSSVTQKSINILNAEGSPIKNLRRWLIRLCKRSGNHKTGCLLTNSAIEVAPHDAMFAKQVRKELQRVELTIEQVLRRAVEREEMDANADIGALATFLLGAAQGLMVLGRLGVTQKKLSNHTKIALSVLSIHEGKNFPKWSS